MERGIEASSTVMVPFDQARQVLSDDAGLVVAGQVSTRDRREHRFRSELAVDLGAGGALSQAVDVDIGPLRASGDAARLPLRWQASGRDRLFPVFDGHLEASPDGAGTRLVVRGTYVVPLGPVGHFGDGLIGRRLARQSLTSFLEDAARRIDAEVHRRSASVSWHPAPYPVALREVGAENYLG